MNKFEAKFKNTAAKMDTALLNLMERKDFNDITVSEICKEADVNRTTFYLHYGNVYELLCEIKDELVKNFLAQYDEQVAIEDLKNYNGEEFVFNSPKYLVPYLEFIKKNKTVFKVFMNNPDKLNIADNDRLNLNEFLATNIRKNGFSDDRIISYMSKFYLTGVMAITSKWIEGDCKDDISFICEVIALCTRHYRSK